jgi:hypothetical protein
MPLQAAERRVKAPSGVGVGCPFPERFGIGVPEWTGLVHFGGSAGGEIAKKEPCCEGKSFLAEQVAF